MITIVGVGSQYVHQNLGVWCLAAGLEQYQLQAPYQVLEININQPIDENIHEIVNTKPEVLGFSCYIWNIERVVKLIQIIKPLLPNCKIICGGPEVSFRAESFLRENPQVEYVLQGEGEYSFYKLCKGIVKGEKEFNDEVPGLCYISEKTFISNPTVPLPLPAPSPYSQQCINKINQRIVYVETSRGCPFSCAFCLSGREGNTVFFDLEQGKKDLILAANSGTKTVKLVDRTFNCNVKRAKELFRFLIKSHEKGLVPKEVCFHFEIGADLFDQESLDLLNSAPKGFFQVEAGIQSFHEETLLASNRKTNMEKLTNNLKKLIAPQNIHVHIDLIAGLPLEDYPLFEASFAKALALEPHMLQLGFLKLIYGSKLQKEQEKHGYIAMPYPPYEVMKSKWLSFEEMGRLKTVEKALDYFYNKGRFPQTVKELLKITKKSPMGFFENLGNEIEKRGGKLSFENSCALLWEMYNKHPVVKTEELRDWLVMDLIMYNNTGYIPGFLRKEEGKNKEINVLVRRKYPKGRKLGIGYLYFGETRVIVGDYQEEGHPVTGEFPTKMYLLKELEREKLS